MGWRSVRRKQKKTPKVKHGKVQRKNFRDMLISPSQAFFVHVECPRLGYEHFLSENDILQFIDILPQKEMITYGLDGIYLVDHSNCDAWYDARKIYICAWEQEMHRVYDALHYIEHKELFDLLSIPCEKIHGKLMHQFSMEYIADLYKGEISFEMMNALSEDWFSPPAFEMVGVCDFQWKIVGNNVELYTVIVAEETLDVYSVDYLCKFTKKTIRDYQLLHILLHEIGHHQDYITMPGKGSIVRGEEYAEIYARKYEKYIWDTYFSVFC